jgi:hypothetical protein
MIMSSRAKSKKDWDKTDRLAFKSRLFEPTRNWVSLSALVGGGRVICRIWWFSATGAEHSGFARTQEIGMPLDPTIPATTGADFSAVFAF